VVLKLFSVHASIKTTSAQSDSCSPLWLQHGSDVASCGATWWLSCRVWLFATVSGALLPSMTTSSATAAGFFDEGTMGSISEYWGSS